MAKSILHIMCSNCGSIYEVAKDTFVDRTNIFDWEYNVGNKNENAWIEGVDGKHYCPTCSTQEVINTILQDYCNRPLNSYYKRFDRKLPRKSLMKRILLKKKYSSKDIDDILRKIYEGEL
jgi:hypothetical protein